MFSHITDFSHKNNPLSALGFYVCYFGFILIVGTVLGFALHLSPLQYSVREGILINRGFTTLICLGLALLIVQSKGLNTNVPLLLLSLCSGLLAFHGGAFLGLIIPTFLSMLSSSQTSTRSPKKKSRRK